MTETMSPTAVMYGSGKPEQPAAPKPEKSNAVSGVRKAVDAWLDRIGTKNVEKHFVEAHERILATLDSDQRKEVFAKDAERWRKTGKALGIAATVIDTGLSAYGFGLSFFGLSHPERGAQVYEDIIKRSLELRAQDNPNIVPGALIARVNPRHFDIPEIKDDTNILDIINNLTLKSTAVRGIGTKIALIPGALSSISVLGMGPVHALSHMAAFGAEQIGKIQARTTNYVDSGKAAEHAKKVGNAIGKAATETAKYAAEHPEQIISAVETANRIHRDNTESAQKMAAAKQKAADIALEKEYQDWLAHHPDKAYYEQSGIPYPSKAEYVAKKKADEAAQKASHEAQERGVAKH